MHYRFRSLRQLLLPAAAVTCGLLSCAAAAQVTFSAASIPSTLAGTYDYTTTQSFTNSPIKSGQSLTMIFRPDGGLCVAGFLLTNPTIPSSLPNDAIWVAYSLGMTLQANTYATSLNQIGLTAIGGNVLAILSGTRTSTSTTGCATGSSKLDAGQLNTLFAKAEDQYPSLFAHSPDTEAFRIVGDTISRVYAGSGITVSVNNDVLSVTGGPWGSSTAVIGKASELLTALLNPQQAPRAFPDLPVSWTLAGAVLPALIKRSADAATRADELAGVARDAVNNWKLVKPDRSNDQMIAALVPRLKSMGNYLWSGGTSAFPESYSLDEGTVGAMIDELKTFAWETVLAPAGASPIKADEISNVSYDYLYLKMKMADGGVDHGVFGFVPRDAVSLASPGSYHNDVNLKLMGPRIKAWVLDYLVKHPDSGSGNTSANDLANIQNISQAFVNIATGLLAPASTIIGTISSNRLDIWNWAARLPTPAYSRYIKAVQNYSDWYLNLEGPCKVQTATSTSLLLPAICNTALAQQGDVSLEYLLAGAEAASLAASASGSSTTGTATFKNGGEYYQAFLVDLAKGINGIYENEFDSFFKSSDATTVAYKPLVITAVLHDGIRHTTGTNDNCCGFRSDELAYYGQARAGVLYRSRGEDVKFQGKDGNRFDLGPLSNVERRDITAASLNARNGTALTAAMEVVVLNDFNVAAGVAGCVATDNLCMQRLTRLSASLKSYEHSASPLDLSGWAYYIGQLRSLAAQLAGIDLSSPVDFVSTAQDDLR